VKLTRSFTAADQLPELLDLAAETARAAGLPDALAFKAQVVLEELFVNIFMHAYAGQGGTAEITLEAQGGRLLLSVADCGPPFDPLSAAETDLRKRFEQGVPGGAGLALVRNMVADARYVREKNRNILHLCVEA
jgi:anti-sigma regulatory factor (Ser/Thr protein kinase)